MLIRRMIRLLAVGALVLGPTLFAPEAAATACTSHVDRDDNGKVRLVVECPDDVQEKARALGKRQCFAGSMEVPCRSDQGSWYSPRGCYIALATGIPRSDPAWQGRRDGRLYYCRVSGLNTGSPLLIWLPTGTAPPDPELLARRAVSRMQLQPIEIGIVPEDRPDRVGLVGMPVWLWVADPAPRTWGPIARSASAGGYTVRATATVSRVRWLMGDGTAVLCTSPGTAYSARFGLSMSPNCGYRYQQQGVYAVTAVSQWLVRWSGIGESGTFVIELTSRTQIQVGELQVTTVNGGR